MDKEHWVKLLKTDILTIKFTEFRFLAGRNPGFKKVWCKYGEFEISENLVILDDGIYLTGVVDAIKDKKITRGKLFRYLTDRAIELLKDPTYDLKEWDDG